MCNSANLPDGDVIKSDFNPAGITGPATLEANTILQGDLRGCQNNYRYGKDEAGDSI